MVFMKSLLQNINPDYKPVLTSFTTLLCEHFFGEMRGNVATPLVHQFAISFTSCTREMIKRLTTTSFHYYTSPGPSYYSRPSLGFITFPELPVMTSTKVHITQKELDVMKAWREEFGQSVRQVTVRNFSMKDRPGTLPYWVYELQDLAHDPYRFLTESQSNALSDDISTVPKMLLFRQSNPPSVILVSETLTAENRKETYVLYIQSPSTATEFTSSGKLDQDKENLSSYNIIHGDMYEIKDDIIFIKSEVLDDILLANDKGDTTGVNEDSDSDGDDDSLSVPSVVSVPTQTRSGRTIKHTTNSMYYWY
jgi:hypothetical protein